jgi:hypothetical protein
MNANTDKLKELLAPMKEVLRISDRKHDAWDASYKVIAEIDALAAQPVQPSNEEALRKATFKPIYSHADAVEACKQHAYSMADHIVRAQNRIIELEALTSTNEVKLSAQVDEKDEIIEELEERLSDALGQLRYTTKALSAAEERTVDQPSIKDLMKAFNNCCRTEGVIGAQTEYLVELNNMRELKHTWVGKEENDFRFMCDAYLHEQGMGTRRHRHELMSDLAEANKKIYELENNSWSHAIEWLRNNYQDYKNISDTCEAMRTASTAPAKEGKQS